MELQTEAAPSEQPVDVLADYREQAKAELGEKNQRSKMSEAASQKLRTLKEQDRAQDIIDARFAVALKSVIVTPQNLAKLIERCNISPAATQVERRAQKLNWWITAGFRLGEEIDSVTMVNFFSELVGDELTMSDARFTNAWDTRAAAKLKESRMTRGLIESGEPVYRPCKSGQKCLRYERRKPAPAKGKGEYCSTACGASDKARVKRAVAASATTSVPN